MEQATDLIIIGKLETVDYKGYSQFPIDRIDMYRELVQLRMVYQDSGFHHFLDIFNEVNNYVYLDSDSGLWYLTYLRDKNYDWRTIESAQKIIVEMLRRDNQNKHQEKTDLFSKFSETISHVNA